MNLNQIERTSTTNEREAAHRYALLQRRHIVTMYRYQNLWIIEYRRKQAAA